MVLTYLRWPKRFCLRLPYRIEPFGRYGRLTLKQAIKARSYSPDRRSRPPDPLRRSKRPARISPSGRVIFLAPDSWLIDLDAGRDGRLSLFRHSKAKKIRMRLSVCSGYNRSM